jgi:NAD(P)-dependent dehydrogenase (short-subunit alcohol dehydrogenase family)
MGERSERTYVVTGSASGIGAATSKRLTDAGRRVIGVDLHDADVIADLSTPEGRAALVDGVRAASDNHVDAVVAGAGLSGDDPILVRVNYFGAIATLEGLRPLLANAECPRAATICSVALLHPLVQDVVDACLDGDEERAVAAAEGQGFLVYASTKRALARWIRRNAPTDVWAGAGIPLNAVAPGVVVTPMTAPLIDDPTWHHLLDESVPMPLGGYAQPEEIAVVLEWLTSPENTKVTGQVIFVDGGADVTIRPDEVWTV